jgi:hypothetical protein
MTFNDAMNEAFTGLARMQQCPGHVYGEPRTESWHPHGPKRPAATAWYATCRKCGMRFSRDTLERLRAEAPGFSINPNAPELRRILGGPAPYRTDHRLCRAPGTRDRVCAEYLGHDGPHNFVLQTQRET